MTREEWSDLLERDRRAQDELRSVRDEARREELQRQRIRNVQLIRRYGDKRPTRA